MAYIDNTGMAYSVSAIEVEVPVMEDGVALDIFVKKTIISQPKMIRTIEQVKYVSVG